VSIRQERIGHYPSVCFSISGQFTTMLVSLLRPFIPVILDILPWGLSRADATERNMAKSELELLLYNLLKE